MSVPISVVIPVGPLAHQREHLSDCLLSVYEQTQKPDEIVIVLNDEDQNKITPEDRLDGIHGVVTYSSEITGISDAFNEGVRHSRNELVFLLGSDDLIKPNCLELCYAAYQHFQQPLGWYSVGVEYSNGYTQNTPCLAAMVTKTLWNKAGGLKRDYSPYPACEVEFISRMLLANGELGATYRVSDEVLYWHRIHTPGSVGIG
jgi:glycosyltransferase involved in cell wall biosynthesis